MGEYDDQEYEEDEYESGNRGVGHDRAPEAPLYEQMPSPDRGDVGSAQHDEIELVGYDSNSADGMELEGFAPSGEDGTFGSGELDINRTKRVVGSPPLRPIPRLPDLLRSLPTTGGLISLLRYGFKAPKLAQRQRDLVQALGVQVAKVKRDEQDILVALGRAARVHGLAPQTCTELIDATVHQEQRAKHEHLRTSEKKEQKEAAEVAYESSRTKGEGQLEGLESQRAGLLSRYEGAKKRLDDAEENLESLRKREQVLRKPPGRRLSDEDVTERVQEFEAVKAQRKIGEMEIETLRDQVRAAERPMERIDSEISEVRNELQDAENRLSNAEGMVKAAEVSVERRQESARRTLKELYEEVGRHVIGSTYRPGELRQLIASVNDAERRIDQWDEVLRDQQLELERFDEQRARMGFWILIGAVFGGIVLLFSGGEIFRRLIAG